MTDKITTEAATIWLEVEIKRILHEVHTDDLKSTIEVNSRVTALEMAIEALKQNEILKALIKRYYAQEDVSAEIDGIACKQCKLKNKGCPVDYNKACPLTDDKALDIYIKYVLEEER